MNYLSPRDLATKGALAESDPKKVSLYPNLGSRKAGKDRAKTTRLSYCNGNDAMITAAQLRAARGLLDWTRADLAKAANISPETVKNIEHGTFKPQENTAEAIIHAFAAQDVEFTENEGVRLANKSVKLYPGVEGYGQFLDFIYEQMKNGGDTYQLNYPDSVIKRFGGNVGKSYLERMSAVSNLNAKCLVPEGDTNFPAKYCQYRWLPKSQESALPYYMFGDHVSLLSALSDDDVVFIVIHSPLLAKILREQFERYWDSGLKIPDNASKANRD
jgi:DNA-binding XRE family transcriptional regulator